MMMNGEAMAFVSFVDEESYWGGVVVGERGASIFVNFI